MAANNEMVIPAIASGNWVRLRTLIYLRWLAICGQLGAIAVAGLVYDLNLPLDLVFTVIGASVLFNVASQIAYPEAKRLTDGQATGMLLFDMTQLSLLTYLMGGLNNPFILLIMAPVTIAASILSLRSALFLGAMAMVSVSILAWYYIPLRTAEGFVHQMPDLFLFGFWIAIVIGIVFLGLYARRVSSEIQAMTQALMATQMALAREQKLTDLGGVVAATAHELGTPLATIKLVSSEMLDDLDGELREDALLINEQADRCRTILRSMGRAGKDDIHLQSAPIEAVINEAAEPHKNRGKDLIIDIVPISSGTGRQPVVRRHPEIIHGLRNLVQNAVDFAKTTVWVEVFWDESTIKIRIVDDGGGFAPTVLGRIGDPFMRERLTIIERPKRPAYEGMGLGLFIAKTLLERTSAELRFFNADNSAAAMQDRDHRIGAVVEVIWNAKSLIAEGATDLGPLGNNQNIVP